MVYIEEIRSGRIPHALKCALPPAAHRGPSNWTDLHPTRVVLPATRSDGSAADTANAPPYGSRYQLDPTIDVTTLASDFDTQVVLKCLQEFGAYDTDNTGGGGMALYGSSPRSQVPGYPFRPGTPNGGEQHRVRQADQRRHVPFEDRAACGVGDVGESGVDRG